MVKKDISETESRLRDRLDRMKKMADELNKLEIVELAKLDRYIRIGGESFRAVSLREDYPLCGCAKSGTRQLATIDRHFKKCEGKLPMHVLEKKKERKLQCWIIKQSLINNRNMMIFLNKAKGCFDELVFALDEVSLGDKKNPVAKINGLRLNGSPMAVRCDLLAVGSKDGKTFPVLIELKSSRNKKDLIAQIDNFAELICRFKDCFIPLLETCTGLQINDYNPRKIIVWPTPQQQNSITQKHLNFLTNIGISILEYNDSVENNISSRYVFNAHWAK